MPNDCAQIDYEMSTKVCGYISTGKVCAPLYVTLP